MEKWSKEKAWAWYNNRTWIRGFNYVASDCASIFDQWQEYEHERKIATFDREFALAHDYGFNSVRLVLPFWVWYNQHDGFMERLERVITIAHKYEIGVMPVFGNDCTVSKSVYAPPKFGPQKIDYGYHGGIARSPHDSKTSVDNPGYSMIDEPELQDAFVKMVGEIVGKYAQDERIEIFDIFNEPGNGCREMKSYECMVRFFEEARSKNPIQPLTSCAWTVNKNRDPQIKEIERKAIELSDIVSYHDYMPYELSVEILDVLKEFDRPIINTEWLHRIYNNNVKTHLPLFYLEKVGCYNWGLVAGLNQTYEPWGVIWTRYEEGKGNHYDFTKWQHDLFRPNLRPYDPKEMDTFKKFAAYADEKFQRDNK